MKEFSWGHLELTRMQLDELCRLLNAQGRPALPAVMTAGLSQGRLPIDSWEAECMTLCTLLNAASHLLQRLRLRWRDDQDSKRDSPNGR